MLNLAGAEQRQDDLFANENFFSRGKSALKGLKVGSLSRPLAALLSTFAGRRERLHAALAAPAPDD